MNEPVFIGDTDLMSEKMPQGVFIYDCDGDFIFSLPTDYSDRDIEIWVAGYLQGMKDGQKWGESSGIHKAQNAVLKALGLDDRLLELERNVKDLAGTLYRHDGIHKEDVAHIAGRE